MEKWMAYARDLGFAHVQSLDMATLEFRGDIRAMCALNLCGQYHQCRTCPPVCGDPETCRRRLKEYSRGFLVQTLVSLKTGSLAQLQDAGSQCHRERFTALCEALYPEYPQALCLISGGCRVCQVCAWPEPCPHPEKAVSCPTGYGLLTPKVLRDNGIHRDDEDVLGFTGFVLLP